MDEYGDHRVLAVKECGCATFHLRDKFVQHVTLKDDENKKFSEKVAFVLIDLTKFAAQTDFGKLHDLREKWCYVIKNMWRMTDGEIPKGDAPFRELYEECKLSKLSDMEKEEYAKSILEYDDVKDAIEYNRRLAREEGREEGRAEGREEGRAEGREEGRAEGREQGREEGIEQGIQQGEANTKRLLAKNMLAEGIPPAVVARISGLTEDEIMALTRE